jgi:hypothetical protein
LCFMERYKNSLSLPYCAFLLILHHIQSAVFCECHQCKSEYVFQVLPLVHYVPTSITSSLFMGFERISNEWKVEKVSYEFGIVSFLRLYLD